MPHDKQWRYALKVSEDQAHLLRTKRECDACHDLLARSALHVFDITDTLQCSSSIDTQMVHEVR